MSREIYGWIEVFDNKKNEWEPRHLYRASKNSADKYEKTFISIGNSSEFRDFYDTLIEWAAPMTTKQLEKYYPDYLPSKEDPYDIPSPVYTIGWGTFKYMMEVFNKKDDEESKEYAEYAKTFLSQIDTAINLLWVDYLPYDRVRFAFADSF